VRISLADPNAADYAGRVTLADLDELVVFGRAQLVNAEKVGISGFVKREGEFPFSSGMSVQDLVLLAGGFREGAQELEAEVARRQAGVVRDTLAEVFKVPLRLPITADSTGRTPAAEFALQPGDLVFVRRQAGYVPLQTVKVSGEVLYPGGYAIESNAERISRVVRRAGGLTAQAYAPGFRLMREGKLVGVDLVAALEKPGGPDDLPLRADDELIVPVFDPTVLVTGAVAFESRVRYEPGLDLDDYLGRAGGTLPEADQGRISVRYANGELRTTRSVLKVKRFPDVQPGSVITVPARAQGSGFNWDGFLTRSLAVASTLATLLLAVRALD
jgi:protein involved in polysaccharide export with SLBB domain